MLLLFSLFTQNGQTSFAPQFHLLLIFPESRLRDINDEKIYEGRGVTEPKSLLVSPRKTSSNLNPTDQKNFLKKTNQLK